MTATHTHNYNAGIVVGYSVFKVEEIYFGFKTHYALVDYVQRRRSGGKFRSHRIESWSLLFQTTLPRSDVVIHASGDSLTAASSFPASRSPTRGRTPAPTPRPTTPSKRFSWCRFYESSFRTKSFRTNVLVLNLCCPNFYPCIQKIIEQIWI
jgi:hypothetical protein